MKKIVATTVIILVILGLTLSSLFIGPAPEPLEQPAQEFIGPNGDPPAKLQGPTGPPPGTNGPSFAPPY